MLSRAIPRTRLSINPCRTDIARIRGARLRETFLLPFEFSYLSEVKFVQVMYKREMIIGQSRYKESCRAANALDFRENTRSRSLSLKKASPERISLTTR